MPIDYSVTRRVLSLGAADPITGLYAKDYSTTLTIELIKLPKGATFTIHGVGYHSRYSQTGWTQDPILEGDEILDLVGDYFEVTTVEKLFNGDDFICYECELVKVSPHANRPSTSGTWHKDATTTPQETDVRYRQKYWLNAYLAPASLLEDDGVTQASYIICFDGADYPIWRVFENKGVDLIFSIGNGEADSLIDHNMKAYAYHETVPIELVAVNKTTITATNLIEQAVQELRRIAETYPTGSLRLLGKMNEANVNMDTMKLYSQRCILEYTRAKVA